MSTPKDIKEQTAEILAGIGFPADLLPQIRSDSAKRLRAYRKKQRSRSYTFTVQEDGKMLVAECADPRLATQGKNPKELAAMIREIIHLDRTKEGCRPTCKRPL